VSTSARLRRGFQRLGLFFVEKVGSSEPIFIVGPPRSGTLMVARVIGTSPDVFLITEHSNHITQPRLMAATNSLTPALARRSRSLSGRTTA
jgi:hypothetical protein